MPIIHGREKGYPVGSFEWDGRRLHRTYDDMWLVEADTENDGPNTVITGLGIPIGASFYDDVYAYAKKVGPAKRDPTAQKFWHVPIFFTTQFPLDEISDLGKKPDERRLRRRWSYESMSVAITEDAITGDPLVNSVNEPFELTTDITIPVLTVERYEEDFPPATILSYGNHVNSDVFYGAPAKTALMTGISVEEDAAEVHEGIRYDRVQYVIKFKIPVTEDNKGWLARVIDMGTQHKSGGTLIPYWTDESAVGKKERITGPLDGNGNRLTQGADLVVLPDGNGFNVHETAVFGALGIGEND